MKKFAMFVGLALVMLATSCTTDTTDVNLNGAKVTLGVSLDQTRTYMGELNNGQYPVLWSEGDQILVNNKVVAVPAQYAGKASLEVAVDAAEAYNVAYPADLIYNNELTISEVQKYVDGSFAVGSGVMVGYSTTATGVALKNLYGYLKFTVTGAANVNAVTVIAEGGESISGTYAIDYQNATITPLAGKDIIRVTKVAAKDGVATVVVAVPAGEYSKGFAVKVKDNANGVMVKSLKGAGGVVEAGTVYAMPEVAYAATATETEITTVAELKAFIAAANAGDYSAYVSADGEVKLGADLDLTGETLEPVTSFVDGVFNGQGYALKNWATARGLFAENKGVVKNIVIDASCTLTSAYNTSGDKNVGFVVENNGVLGTVSGCVNNGKVVITDLSCAAHRTGGVVGVSYGIVHDCINYGTIDVTSQTVGNNQMVGGVVGYINTNASTKDALGKDFLVNCINYGEVKVLFPCQPKSAFVGGVLGATQMAKSSAAVYLGQIKNCINYGKVSYRFETLSSGTYGNVGGVIGYAQANMEGCDNHGEVSFTTPADDLTQGGTRPALGGVVGCNVFKTVGCNNYGKVFAEGVWAAGTQDNSGAGSQGGSTFAGVAGCTGVYNVYSEDYNVEDCHNYGEVEINNNCKVDGGTKGWHAGVVGYTTGDVKNCSNDGVVTIKHNTYENYSAGVVGETKGGVYNCSCNAPVYAEAVNVSKAGGALYFAGIVGYSTIVVENCHLNADFTAKTNNADGSLRFAGIAGQIKTASTRQQTITGGTVKEGVKLTFTTDNGKANYCGGIIGLANNGIGNCVNGGDIDIKVTELFEDNDITYVAGIAGAQQEDATGCTNNGDITVDMFNSTGPFYAGTIVGDNKKAAATLSACHNTGNLTIVNAGNTEFVGTYVGHNADDTVVVDEASCTNTGVITVNGTELGGGAEALSIDGKQWQLPEAVVMQVVGASTVGVADLGVSAPGQLIVGASLEPVYGPDAAGQWQIMITAAYTVEVTDATSGKIVLMQTNMYDEVTKTELPYKNLTAESVTIDFTNMGIGGEAVCTLYTENAPLAGGGGVAM
ncbi:MAG: hypothetical protein IJO17_03850 [Alistipes sp.]|nr:hypothetical protein [Alistipes sp.]